MTASHLPDPPADPGKHNMAGLRANGSVFRLEGPSRGSDPRVDAIRPDLADIELAHRHFAPHYAAAAPRSCDVPLAAIHAEPNEDAPLVSELLYGEGFGVLDFSGGWAWGYTASDHCVGYVRASALADKRTPTHRLPDGAQMTGADGRVTDLPMGALFEGAADGDRLIGGHGWVPTAGAVPINHRIDDPVRAAEMMVGAPYREGGRTKAGVDAPALIQCVLAKGGIDAPREIDRQYARLGGDMALAEPLTRGDILFLVDHVGIMADDDDIIHASPTAGKVVREPLADLVTRLEASGQKPALVGRKRLLG